MDKIQNIWLPGLFFALFSLFPISVPLSSVAMLLIIITWLFSLKNPDLRHSLIKNKFSWIWTGFFLFMLINILPTPSTWKWIGIDLGKYAKLIYACILLSFFTTYQSLQRHALHGFIAAMSLILLLTWVSVWVELPWTWSYKNHAIGNHSVFGDYIVENIMMSLFCIMAAFRAWSNNYKRNHRILWGLIAVLSFLSITTLSMGRTGFLVLLAGFSTAVLVGIKTKWRWLFLSTLLIGGTLAFTLSSTLHNRFEIALHEAQNSDNHETSIGHRLYNYKTSLQLISEKPVIGHGTGAFHTEICRFLKPGLDCQIYNWHPHNQFLFFMVDYGLFGCAFYIAMIFGMYLTAFRSKPSEAKILLSALATILVVDSLINSPMYSSIESHFFLYMSALLVSFVQLNHRRSEVS